VEFYGNNKKSIDDFFEKCKESGLTEKNILSLIKNKEKYKTVPISIFDNSLSPLEAIVQYLRQENYSLNEISKILNRSNKTIWTTYDNALKKRVKLRIEAEIFIPLSIFSNRTLSTLENISVYLKEELSFSFTEISRLLGKNKNTIWTVYNRAVKKLK